MYNDSTKTQVQPLTTKLGITSITKVDLFFNLFIAKEIFELEIHTKWVH